MIHYVRNCALRLITLLLISLPSWERFALHALYQHSHELTPRSEFHRYLSRDLISEIMAELFARYIIRDNSSYDGKEKTINVRCRQWLSYVRRWLKCNACAIMKTLYAPYSNLWYSKLRVERVYHYVSPNCIPLRSILEGRFLYGPHALYQRVLTNQSCALEFFCC